MKNQDILLGIVVILFSIYGIFESLELPSGQSSVPSSFYPNLLFLLLGFCGLLLLIKGIRSNCGFPNFNFRKILPIIGLFIFYAILLNLVGYIFSTFLFFLMTMLFLGVRNIYKLVGIPLFTSLAIYSAFVYGFNIYLP